MKADKIKEIYSKLNSLPYQKILFNGTWGIGKTKYVKESAESDNDAYYISLFGKKDINSFYEELYYQLVSKNKRIIKEILKPFEKIEFSKFGFNVPIPLVMDLLKSIQKELKQKSNIIIIIDDLERKSDKLELKEIFGFVDLMTRDSSLKVVFVASTEHISEDEEEHFKSYFEKSIDREYKITEYSESAPKSIFGKDTWELIKEIYEINIVKNLRILEKTRDFINEVTNEIPENNYNERFNKKDFYKICAAVVLNSVNVIKSKQDSRLEESYNAEKNHQSNIYNNLLEKNLNNTMMRTFIPFIMTSYQTGEFNKARLDNLIEEVNAIEKSNIPLFMSQEELKEVIGNLAIFSKDLIEKENISRSTLLQRLDEIALIQENTNIEMPLDVDELADKLVSNLNYRDMELEDHLELLPETNSKFARELESKLKTKFILKQINMFSQKLIEVSKSKEIDDDVIELTDEFKQLCYRLTIKKDERKQEERQSLIKLMKDNGWFVPLPYGKITYEHWKYCHNIFRCIEQILENDDKKNILSYFKEKINESTDEMFKYRVKSLIKQYLA